MSVLTIDLPGYSRLLLAVQQKLSAQRRGTQQQLSYDLRVNATVVSQVVLGTRIDENLLVRISEWLDNVR